MTTETFVAQCPHCRTSFRVSRAQLGAAHGAVRCGACLHVFNAARQVLADAPASPPVAAKPTATPQPLPAQHRPAAPAPAGKPSATPSVQPVRPARPGDDSLRIHDDMDLGDLDLDRELERLEQEDHPLRPHPAAPVERLLNGIREIPPADDRAWAKALLDEENAVVDDLPADPALGELPDPEALPPPRGGGAAPTGAAASPPPRARADRLEGSLEQLSEAPLQLDWQKPKKPWGRWVGWSLLILLALLALAGQYIYYHYADLARQDRYRPWFELACPHLGCSLPPRVDIAQIKSSNLVVRSHPRYTGALIVDAILYNRATFAQPFPLLEMRFADINGQVLASRRFKPSEYLSGELAGQREMPPQTPIHISLDILDPGAEAVNYSLGFHSPE